jgi:hypothetical protein
MTTPRARRLRRPLDVAALVRVLLGLRLLGL